MLFDKDYEPTALCWDYNIFPFADVLSDPAIDNDPIQCYKFVSVEFNSRILIKIDRDQMTP